MATDQKQSSFNILGSSKLNTPDGKNPPTTDRKEPSFNILGSSKLNTPDGKNPPTTDQKEHSFNILGSSKLNTPDGKNPPTTAATTTQAQPDQATIRPESDEYKKACREAHDALENKLRESEREARWRRE